jgi:hypothetical protein
MFNRVEIVKPTVYIVGAGASGLVAAIAAAERGARVVMLEKMAAPGRKLAITGNSRCNITNTASVEEAIKAFGPNGKFLRSAFFRFFSAETISLFDSLGVPTVVEEGGRVFPKSGRAADVVDALTRRCAVLGVEIRTECGVTGIVAREGRIARLDTTQGRIAADRVLLAAGGASYPKTGSTGDGYRIAATLGHTVIPPRPALVPLELRGDLHKKLSAVSFRDARVKLLIGNKPRGGSEGDILFTPFGVTGPAALALGKSVASNQDSAAVAIEVNFIPPLDKRGADNQIASLLSAAGARSALNALSGLLPRRAMEVLTERAGISPETKAAVITKEKRVRLAGLLTESRFEVRGVRPLAEAIVTAGGAAVDEIDPRTMQSRLVKGLYFSGETIDIDACTGGYNLQAAFSTGRAAGCAMATI